MLSKMYHTQCNDVRYYLILSLLIQVDTPTYQLTQYLTQIWHGIYWFFFAFHTKLWHPADFPSQEKEQNSGNWQEIKYFPNVPNVPNVPFSTAGWQYHLPASTGHNISTAQISNKTVLVALYRKPGRKEMHTNDLEVNIIGAIPL